MSAAISSGMPLMVTQDLALQGMFPVSVVDHLNYYSPTNLPFFPLSPILSCLLYFCHPSFRIAC